MMDEERSLSDVLWDYGVYVPIGLAATLVEELGRLTEKGKQRAGGQVHTAQVIGKLAVGEGRRQFAKLFGETPPGGNHRAAPHGTAGPRTPRSSSPAPAERGDGGREANAARRRSTRPTRTAEPVSDAAQRRAEPAVAPARSAPSPPNVPPAPDVLSLAIPGYDTLAASQVVQRLSSLRPDELEAIRRYELATRGRRTILHRIAQLGADG